MSKVVYETTVTKVGDLVSDFREQSLLVWFGEGAPEELHEFSILHQTSISDDSPLPGDRIELQSGSQVDSFTVLAVGDVARDNLLNLGHLDLKANGLDAAELPGDVNVEVRELPMVKAGDIMRVIRERD